MPKKQQELLQNRVWVSPLTLQDREDILSNKWLNSFIITHAMEIMQKTYPDIQGLVNTGKFGNPSDSSDIPFIIDSLPITGKFVQIYNTPNHFVTVAGSWSETKIELEVYDSLNLPTAIDSILSYVSAQFKGHPSVMISFRQMEVTQQKGGDCGLHAIANAVLACRGINPSTVRFVHEDMRSHLVKCIEDDAFELFAASEESMQVHVLACLRKKKVCCSCRKAVTSTMLQCCRCLEKFHMACVKQPVENPQLWYCESRCKAAVELNKKLLVD